MTQVTLKESAGLRVAPIVANRAPRTQARWIASHARPKLTRRRGLRLERESARAARQALARALVRAVTVQRDWTSARTIARELIRMIRAEAVAVIRVMRAE